MPLKPCSDQEVSPSRLDEVCVDYPRLSVHAGDPTAICRPPPSPWCGARPGARGPCSGRAHSPIGNSRMLAPCFSSLLLPLPRTSAGIEARVPTPHLGVAVPTSRGPEPACTHTRGWALGNVSISGRHITRSDLITQACLF